MSEKEKDQHKGELFDVGDVDDLFGLNEKVTYIPFQCVDCGFIDQVPEFIIGEFSLGLEEGEEVEMFCPECNGTLCERKKNPGTKLSSRQKRD